MEGGWSLGAPLTWYVHRGHGHEALPMRHLLLPVMALMTIHLGNDALHYNWMHISSQQGMQLHMGSAQLAV